MTESVIAQGLRTGGWLSKEYAAKADAIRARRRIAHAVKSLDNVTTEARYVDLAGGKVKLSIRITKAE